jgi:transcriptional regulator GlxA family with amidase domain
MQSFTAFFNLRSILSEININRCRLDRAKWLQKETDVPVCRSANESGFANTMVPNRIFRREEEKAPVPRRFVAS